MQFFLSIEIISRIVQKYSDCDVKNSITNIDINEINLDYFGGELWTIKNRVFSAKSRESFLVDFRFIQFINRSQTMGVNTYIWEAMQTTTLYAWKNIRVNDLICSPRPRENEEKI